MGTGFQNGFRDKVQDQQFLDTTNQSENGGGVGRARGKNIELRKCTWAPRNRGRGPEREKRKGTAFPDTETNVRH